MKRREFLVKGAAGLATIVVGSQMAWLSGCGSDSPATSKLVGGDGVGGGGDGAGGGGVNPATTIGVQSLNFSITDCIKEMSTHNSTNEATSYCWCYKDGRLSADCPGPNIIATEDEMIDITLTNELDEPHAFFIRGVFNSGPIAPGESKSFTFKAPEGGTYLYYDNLNDPVNRVMGLHGAFVSMPKKAALGHKFTPFSKPTAAIQKLFDDFGSSPWWPGLAWEEGDSDTHTPPFRQYIWLCSQFSSRLFKEVGDYTPGKDYPAAEFVDKFLNDPFQSDGLNMKPEFFTINGQSGHFSHNSPYICPNNRVGEPVIIRCLNGGLITHSLHIHANHVYVLSENEVISSNPLWVDTYTLHPMNNYVWAVPYMRPPDIPNERGIGRADTPQTSLNGHPVWPPLEELNSYFPSQGTKASNGVNLAVRMSPLCFPMHDHSEASQGSQGGNYNCGMISGINFTGDRNTAGGVTTFPDAPTLHGPSETGPAAIEFAEFMEEMG